MSRKMYVANPGYCLIVRDATYKMVGNREVLDKPTLAIYFGNIHGASSAQHRTQEGSLMGHHVVTADFSSGLYDVEEEAQANRWSPEDKQLVEDQLEEAVTNRYHPAYGDIKRYEPPKVNPPWPAYDDAEPAMIVRVADETGMVSEAFQYESLTQKRPAVLGPLEKLLTQEEELTAA